MIELLEYIFSNFWFFMGTISLIGAVGTALNMAFCGLRGVPVFGGDDD